jgi:hypothetical protein
MAKIERCPYKYKTALKISKTLGFFGTDRLYIGKKYSGTLKLMIAVFSLMMSPITLGSSIMFPCFIWAYDIFSIYTKTLVPENCYKDKNLKVKGWRYYINEEDDNDDKVMAYIKNDKDRLENKYKKERSNMTIATICLFIAIIGLISVAYLRR